MTDRIDYTTKPEVLKACGIDWEQTTPKTWMERSTGILARTPPRPSQQELWEGLCKAWREEDRVDGMNRRGTYPRLNGTMQVELAGEVYEIFTTVKYGTLRNAIAAALYTVLQQAEKKEG
jgi:hypothetical protein